MRPETDACPVGTRGARSRASQVASIGCPVRARGGADWGLPSVETGSACRAPRDATAAGGATNNNKLSFARDAASRPAPSTMLLHVVGLRCGRLRCAWAGCPLAKIKSLGLRCRPAASRAARPVETVLKGKRGALGGFSRVLAACLVSLVTSTCTFLKPIFKQLFKRAHSNLCRSRLDVVLARARSGMRAGFKF